MSKGSNLLLTLSRQNILPKTKKLNHLKILANQRRHLPYFDRKGEICYLAIRYECLKKNL